MSTLFLKTKQRDIALLYSNESSESNAQILSFFRGQRQAESNIVWYVTVRPE
jgi:hypothetical protein